MKQTNKLWFWIGLALFAIPEILWSPISNYWYIILQNDNRPTILRENMFTINTEYNFLYYGFIVWLQVIGLILVEIITIKNKQNLKHKWVFWPYSIFIFVGIILSLIPLYLINFVQISFF